MRLTVFCFVLLLLQICHAFVENKKCGPGCFYPRSYIVIYYSCMDALRPTLVKSITLVQ